MDDINIELELASVVMVRLFKSYLERDDVKLSCSALKKPVLMPITRKGYWLFRILFDNSDKFDKEGILSKFDIRSDRYVGKLLKLESDNELSNRIVLLYDDILDKGDNMFNHYVMLHCWGVEDVTPIAYRYVEGYKSTAAAQKDTKWIDFQEILKAFQYSERVLQILHKKFLGCDYNADESVSEEQSYDLYRACLNSFYSAIEKNQERHIISRADRAAFNISIMRLMERELCPLVIDLPIFKERGLDRRYIRFSAQSWNKIANENALWKFVENRSQETELLIVNASFFEAPESVREVFPACFVSDCVIKAKYKEDNNEVAAVLTPFAILRSVGYRDLIQCFCTLYRNDDVYYRQICSYYDLTEASENEVVDILISRMTSDVNLYRAVYRAVVLYFSNYIGMQFDAYLSEMLGADKCCIEYDMAFMEHHMPRELIESIEKAKFGGIEPVRERIKAVRQWERETYFLCDYGNKFKDFFTKDDICDYMRFLIAESKRKSSRRKNPIIFEQIEKEFIEKTNFTEDERREELTKIILFFLEGSIFGNYLKNDTDRKTVLRGFAPGENSTILLGKTVKEIFPYIYSFYRKTTAESYMENYDEFIGLLKSYFERKRYFEYLCSRKGFDVFAEYFRDTGDGSLPRKIEDNFFLVRDYLEGRNTECRAAFELVDKWEIG